MNTQKARMTKSMTVVKNDPYASTGRFDLFECRSANADRDGNFLSATAFVTSNKGTYKLLKSVSGKMPSGGIKTSFTSDVVILPKARADDHAHRQIDHVAAQGKFFEFLEQPHRQVLPLEIETQVAIIQSRPRTAAKSSPAIRAAQRSRRISLSAPCRSRLATRPGRGSCALVDLGRSPLFWIRR